MKIFNKEKENVDVKIGAFSDYELTDKVNKKIITPEKFKKIFEENQRKELIQLADEFHEEVNRKLLQKTDSDNIFEFIPSDELASKMRKYENKFDFIVDEYKKAGWSDLKLYRSTFFTKVMFYMKEEK